MVTCGQCKYIHVVEGQSYHDCRVEAPSVVVSGFKNNPVASGSTVGKIMTVWPRVAKTEVGCGRFSAS